MLLTSVERQNITTNRWYDTDNNHLPHDHQFILISYLLFHTTQVKMHSYIQRKIIDFYILTFSCNQFGAQEPNECPTIKKFANDKGVTFTMMDKIDVNGPSTHPVYKYLKGVASLPEILWNFATYYVIFPDGEVTDHSGVTPIKLVLVVLSHYNDEL